MTADRKQINCDQSNDQGLDLELGQAYPQRFFVWDDHNTMDGGVGIPPYDLHDRVSDSNALSPPPKSDLVTT
jgi:hypothetical protein